MCVWIAESIFVKGIIQLAGEAGGENVSPRRWRSRAWGTGTNVRPSPRSGRQMKRAKNNLREFNLEVQPVIKVNNDRALMRSLRSAPMQNRER